jgi:hypothetical protein
LSGERSLTSDALEDILREEKKPRMPKYYLSNRELTKFFPPGTAHKDAWNTILDLLEKHRKSWQRSKKIDKKRL